MFEFFSLGTKAYRRRAETMLREARFAQLEHEAAAEHHHALARMYAERVARLEGRRSEYNNTAAAATPADSAPPAPPAPAALEGQRGERPPFRVLTQTPAGAQGAG